VIYFSAFISILYYFGAMQWMMFKLSWLMQFSMGTSATESMVAAGSIILLLMYSSVRSSTNQLSSLSKYDPTPPDKTFLLTHFCPEKFNFYKN